MCANFQTKRTTLTFWAQISPKWIFGLKFQKSKSGFGISNSKIPCEPIFNQNGQLWIFRPKFGEIAQLRAIFWFEYYWGCCRELGGGWNELGGGGWTLVEVGAQFSNTHFQNSLRQASKFTWSEVDNWCNFTVSFISELWHICLFLKLQVCTMKLT